MISSQAQRPTCEEIIFEKKLPEKMSIDNKME